MFLGIIYPASMEMHSKTNQLVEQLTEILFLFLTRVAAPGFIMPKFLTSFFIYFTTDDGNEAFELPLPMWYVCVRVMMLNLTEKTAN